MAHGVAHLTFDHDTRTTRQGCTFVRDPLRVLFPRAPADELTTAVLLTTSGGLVGGDRLDIACTVAADAAVLVTSQAAEKVYRSAGPDCRSDVALTVAPRAWLEWLPQETIVFDAARFRRRISAAVAPEGRLLAGEILVLGRAAMGERLRRGLLRDAWEVSVDGRLAWADALHLDGGEREDGLASLLAAPAGFDGAAATATLIYVGADAAAHLALARRLLTSVAKPSLRVGATVIGDVLVSRWLGRDAAVLRRSYAAFRGAFRRSVAGLPDRLPAVWQA